MDFIDPAAVGRYTVLERLGAGAMGVVYLCQDPLLKRRVAVKITQKARSGSDLMVERFQREAEISAQLNHPNIIAVYDVGEDPVVGPFLTMEFVDGCSLSKHIAEGHLDPPTILDWLSQLGQALVAAERAGVVHRDIKPDNILVSKSSQLKLTDFGLARDDASSLTQTGTMMGTPTHTAPELLGGDRATPITDRWAFSVLAFQMVLGGLPHPGDTLSAVLHSIAREQPAIPGGTSPILARVFLKALHKDPTRRFESVLAFLTALAEAMGIKDQLVTKGLVLEPGASSSNPAAPKPANPNETEAFQLPAPPAPPPPPPPKPKPAPVKAAARLTGPPEGLLKGAAEERSESSGSQVGHQSGHQSAQQAPPQTGLPPAHHLAAQGITISSHQPGTRSNPRGWKATPKAEPSGDRSTYLVLGLVAVLGAAGFFFYPRSLVVQTVPPQAHVSVDGKALGLTPCEGSLQFGSHMLEVSLDGYDTVVKEIHAGESPIVLNLQAATTWADITTVPSGASVVVGGRSYGASPCKGVPVPDKPVQVIVTLHGYRRWEGVLGPGKRPPLPIKLERD